MNWAVVRKPTLIVTAIVYGFLISLCLAAGLVGIWLGVLLFVSVWRYSYQVMRAVAQGQTTIPPPDIDSFNLIGEWAVFCHFLLFPGVIIATAPHQPLGMIVAIAVALFFPASAALIGLTASLSRAFNPVAISRFVRTTGRDYWVLVAGSIAILAGSSLLITIMLLAFGIMSSLVGFMVIVWALFASFALIGTLLRKHRLEFEIAGEIKPRGERLLELRHKNWQRDLDIAYISFRSGSFTAGYKTLHDFVAREGDSLEVNFWLVENMLEWEQKRPAFEVAAKLISRLLERGDAAEALSLFQRCKWRDPEFRLPSDVAGQLAAHAVAFGLTGLSAELGHASEDLHAR